MDPTHHRPTASAPRSGALPGASVGIFLAMLAAVFVFSQSSTALLRHPDRAIGLGLSSGVDAARRVTIYLGLVALMLAVGLACHQGARLLGRRRPSWIRGVRSRLENELCALFACAGSVAIVARVSADRLDRLGPALMCLAGLGSVSTFAVVRRSSPRPRWWPRPLMSLELLGILVLLAWPAPYVTGVLVGADGAEKAGLVRAGTVLLPLLYAAVMVHFVRRASRAERPDLCRAFALGAAPFFAFPSLCPVANEVQHALAQSAWVTPRGVALVFLLLLAISAALLFWRARAGQRRWSLGRLLARYVYPTIIFGEALLSVHKHMLVNKRIDALHDGEQITAVHQLFAFDKWPFVDIWSGHGLSDYFGVLYSLVNGFRPLEMTAWNPLLAALSATAAYAILANVGPASFAFVVAALLPIEAILPLPLYSYFCADPGLIAVGLIACLALARPSLTRYSLLALAAFLCFFWTPTSGVAAIAAVLGLFVLTLFTTRERRPIWRGLAVFAGTGVGVFALYALVLALRAPPVLETLRLIAAFIQADPLIGGRAAVIERFDAPAFVQYVLLPGIGLAYLAKLARHVFERRPLGRADLLLGFLTLVSFVLLARALTRHGIIERFQPFFFPLLALCAWLPGQPGAALGRSGEPLTDQRGSLAAHFARRASARVAFCVGLGLFLVWMPMRSHKRLVLDAYQFHAWQPGERRYQGEVPSYPNLSALLARALGPRDSFLELLNMSVLYPLFDRELPGQFFLPTMFYATDSVQDSYLRRLQAFGGSERVPVVLFRDELKRNIDENESTLHRYRIAEHVFRNYVPFGTIDGFDVWVARARADLQPEAGPAELPVRKPEHYQAGMSPFFWGNFDGRDAARKSPVLQAVPIPDDRQPRTAFQLTVNPDLDKSSGNYLKLCIRLPGFAATQKASAWTTVYHEGNWRDAAQLTLSYGAAPAATFALDVVEPVQGTPGLPNELVRSFAEECKPYLVRLSAQYAWNTQAITRIDISSSAPIVLESASILAGD